MVYVTRPWLSDNLLHTVSTCINHSLISTNALVVLMQADTDENVVRGGALHYDREIVLSSLGL